MKQKKPLPTKIKRKKKDQGASSAVSARLMAEFMQFIEYHPAKCLRRNFRKMLLEFLMHERAVESVYMKDLLFDIDGLFDLIDAIEDETEQLSVFK